MVINSSWLSLILLSVGCSSLQQPNSPDVEYSPGSSKARELQVPPDLTDVSDGEQFILPGDAGATVSRNTLLPDFDSVRFVRQGKQSWLEIDQAPEDIWPRLLLFARKEKYRIEHTEPVSGVIVTQWRSSSGGQSVSLLKNLIGADETFDRVAFRLERTIGVGTRLFARSQSASAEVAKADSAVQWPASSHDPEQTSSLLSRLLVFLGVDEQRSKGILNASQVSQLLDIASLQTTAGGSLLVINRGYEPSFKAITNAMQALDYDLASSDDNIGRIEAKATVDATPVIVIVAPVHISAVRVSLTDSDGRRLERQQEVALLDALRMQLI